MRLRAVVVACVAVAVVLAACDGGEESTTTTPTTMSAAQLEAGLLDVSDLPAGWEVGSPINEEDLSGSAQLPCEHAALDPAVAKRLTATTGIQFQEAAGPNKFLIELVVTGDPEQLKADTKAFLDAYESCMTTLSTTPGASIRKLATPGLGDQAAAYAGVPGAPGHLRSGFVRKGSTAVGLGLIEQLPETPQAQPQVSDEQFVRLLETAIDKLSG